VLARTLAATPVARWQAAEYPMVLLAAVLFPLVGAALWLSGALQGLATPLFQALARPEVLAAAGGMETALLLLWLWRMVSAEA